MTVRSEGDRGRGWYADSGVDAAENSGSSRAGGQRKPKLSTLLKIGELSPACLDVICSPQLLSCGGGRGLVRGQESPLAGSPKGHTLHSKLASSAVGEVIHEALLHCCTSSEVRCPWRLTRRRDANECAIGAKGQLPLLDFWHDSTFKSC